MPDANRQPKSHLYDDDIEVEIDFRMSECLYEGRSPPNAIHGL